AVDPAGQQGPHIVLLADRVTPAIAQQDRHLALAERVLGAQHDRDGEPPETVGGDQPDRVASPGEQPTGQRARPEAELFRRGEHPVPGLRPQLAAPVQGLGDRADRHPAPPPAVAETRAVAAPRPRARPPPPPRAPPGPPPPGRARRGALTGVFPEKGWRVFPGPRGPRQGGGSWPRAGGRSPRRMYSSA